MRYKPDPFTNPLKIHIWRFNIHAWKWRCPRCNKGWTVRSVIAPYNPDRKWSAWERCLKSAYAHLEMKHKYKPRHTIGTCYHYPKTKIGTCPYQEEVNYNKDYLCTCCENCYQECRDEI